MTDLPRGTVTFLFTDIEGSTALWERDRAAMHAAVERHFAVLDAAIRDHAGTHFKTIGDAAQAAFHTAPAAIAAALDAQHALLAEDGGRSDPCASAWRFMPGKPSQTRAETTSPPHSTGSPASSPPATAGRSSSRSPCNNSRVGLSHLTLNCGISVTIGCVTCWSQSTSTSFFTQTSRPTFHPWLPWTRGSTTSRASRHGLWDGSRKSGRS